MEAAARKLPRGALGRDALITEGYTGKRPAEHFKRFKGLKAGKRQAERPNNRGRQTAGCNAGTTGAYSRGLPP